MNNNTIDYLRVVSTALKMYTVVGHPRVPALTAASYWLNRAQETEQACKHLWICATIADIQAEVDACCIDASIDVAPLEVVIVEFINELVAM